MTTSEASGSDLTRAPELPPTPDGYADPYEFRYPTVGLLVGSSVLGIVSSVALVALLTLVHGPEMFTFYEVTVDGETTTFAMDLTAIAVPFLAALVVTTVVHELLHGVVFRFYGYDVTYGVAPSMGAFYAAAFGQFQRRAELLRVGLAPLVGITAVCFPLVFVPVPIVALTAAFVLVLNTAGAIGDLYATWRLRGLPEGALLYDVDIRYSYVYEPSA
ncbi:hypothetical protein C491_04600 [Natronococcus amylolyticus DSM 10524]|uniref:Zincin peptidase n=1 Tax=Natronococcus amylolyticus DSM 10524 TaxID=1227497 RepID=L9XIR3_9EURY|nr:DUF3267 domain-containing protein [Natronococcus amylolyticus]ELY60548.1 hypothetical protein C491_04600 [Natronococcus amylolyticus DSM 10524]